MTKSTFTIDSLGKAPAKRRKAATAGTFKAKIPATAETEWGREVIRRITVLRKALDGHKLA